MHRGGRIVVVAALLAAAIGLARPDRAVGVITTGPYTLPFFNPDIFVTQSYGCTGNPYELPLGSCAHFHGAIDYSSDYQPVAAARSGKVVLFEEGKNDDPSCPQPGQYPLGNFILIKHGSDRYTLYYHLQKDGVYVGFNEKVAAGQLIGVSGDSGTSCGPHLHYALTSSETNYLSNSTAIDPAGKWTTQDSGRVPWWARLVSHNYESTGPNSGYQTIMQNSTETHWIKFKNIGGRAWYQSNQTPPVDDLGLGNKRRVYLGSTDAGGNDPRISDFEAADWISNWQVDEADQTEVEPDGIGTVNIGKYTFGLWAVPPPGSYDEYFNLWADVPNNDPAVGAPDNRWFKLENENAHETDKINVTVNVTPDH